MGGFFAKFSDYNPSHERAVAKFMSDNRKTKKKNKPKKKTFKKKEHPMFSAINQAKGLSYSEFLETDYWKKVRMLVLNRDGHKCVGCNKTYGLIVHHMSYDHHGYEHLFLDDLTTLCREHHRIIHGLI